MKEEIKILIISIIFFLLDYVFLLFPESENLHSFFKFNSQLLTIQSYVDYFCDVLQKIVIYYLLTNYIPKYRETLFLIGMLWIGYLVDYVLTYNQPFGRFLFIPLSYAMFMGLSMISILAYKMYKHDT